MEIKYHKQSRDFFYYFLKPYHAVFQLYTLIYGTTSWGLEPMQ